MEFVRVARAAQFGASGSSAGANAQTQTFNQGGGFGGFGGFPAFGASGSQAGANAQTQSFNQGSGFGGFPAFNANAANAGANAGTFSNVSEQLSVCGEPWGYNALWFDFRVPSVLPEARQEPMPRLSPSTREVGSVVCQEVPLVPQQMQRPSTRTLDSAVVPQERLLVRRRRPKPSLLKHTFQSVSHPGLTC